MGLPQVERTITHKLLHRKRPRLFPMLDSITSPQLGERQAWTTIHQDVTSHSEEFAELEDSLWSSANVKSVPRCQTAKC
jgi:hypothetical protein